MLTTNLRKTTLLFCFLLFICSFKSFGQTQQKIYFVYQLNFIDDLTPGNGKSKIYVIKLRKLFKEVNVHYNPTEQSFIVKTEKQRKTVDEYTEIIESHGAVLAEPIEIKKVIIG